MGPSGGFWPGCYPSRNTVPGQVRCQVPGRCQAFLGSGEIRRRQRDLFADLVEPVVDRHQVLDDLEGLALSSEKDAFSGTSRIGEQGFVHR